MLSSVLDLKGTIQAMVLNGNTKGEKKTGRVNN